MLVATISDFRKDIKKYLDKVSHNFETLIINRGKDNGIVIMSLKEYNALTETERLLSTKANSEHLRESVQQLKKGETVSFDLD